MSWMCKSGMHTMASTLKINQWCMWYPNSTTVPFRIGPHVT